MFRGIELLMMSFFSRVGRYAKQAFYGLNSQTNIFPIALPKRNNTTTFQLVDKHRPPKTEEWYGVELQSRLLAWMGRPFELCVCVWPFLGLHSTHPHTAQETVTKWPRRLCHPGNVVGTMRVARLVPHFLPRIGLEIARLQAQPTATIHGHQSSTYRTKNICPPMAAHRAVARRRFHGSSACSNSSSPEAQQARAVVRHGHGRLHLLHVPQAAFRGGVQEEQGRPGQQQQQGAGPGRQGAQVPLQGRRDHAAAAVPRRPLLPHQHPLRRERDDRGAGVHGVGGDAPVPAAQGALRAEREAPPRPLHRQIHPQPLPPKPARPVLDSHLPTCKNSNGSTAAL